MKWTKNILWIVGIIATVGLVTAGWQIFASADIEATVNSTDSTPILFTTSFASLDLQTGNSDDSLTTTATLFNQNSNLDLIFTVDETYVDVEDNCVDLENDCIWQYKIDETNITNEDVILVTAGAHTISATITCQKLSCPAQHLSTVTFAE